LQCVAVCCSVLQCVAVCCSVCVAFAVCCSVLQCVRCSVSLSSLLGTNVTHLRKAHKRMFVCMEFIHVNICVWLHARDKLILCMIPTVTFSRMWKETYVYAKRSMNIVYICMSAWKGQTDSMHDSDSYFWKETYVYAKRPMNIVYMCMAACKGQNWFYAWLRQLRFEMWKETYMYAKRPMNIVYMCMAACKGQTDSMHDSDSYFWGCEKRPTYMQRDQWI